MRGELVAKITIDPNDVVWRGGGILGAILNILPIGVNLESIINESVSKANQQIEKELKGKLAGLFPAQFDLVRDWVSIKVVPGKIVLSVNSPK